MTPSTPTNTSSPRPPEKRGGVDAAALLRSLAPVVAKPEFKPEPTAAPAPVANDDSTSDEPRRPSDAGRTANNAPKRAKPPVQPVRRWVPADDEVEMVDDSPAPSIKAGPRATLDVAINPGEGSTAIYVRVPRTTHVALKLLALQNQAAMSGPTELASIVRTAIDEYLRRQQNQSQRRAA